MADPPGSGAELGRWLRQLRETAGLSQEDAGAAMGTDRRSIRRWEKGDAPNGLTLLRLFSAYGVEVKPQPPDGVTPRAMNAELARIAVDVASIAGLKKDVEALDKKLDQADLASRLANLEGAVRELRTAVESIG